MGFGRSLLCFFMILTILSTKHIVSVTGQGLVPGYYDNTCPLVELVVRTLTTTRYTWQRNIAPGLLKLQFSDCFVEGCDGSVPISGPGTERTASFNANLRGFELIDDIKRQLEVVCPGVVSCADILALATRNAVVLAGGPPWEVKLGRRDGRVSLEENVRNLPFLSGSVPILIEFFATLGFTTEEYVALVGGHTIGTASCKYIDDGSCPAGELNRLALDRGSQFRFDTSIFSNILNNTGVLKTDQDLSSNPNTSPILPEFLDRDNFYTAFAKAMVKLSEIGAKTGGDGEIRQRCSAIN